jgi:16S rRNA (guanine527-N7)-methyltransferase
VSGNNLDSVGINRLKDGLRKLGLEAEGVKAEALTRYIKEIELWNPRYGMIAPGEDLIGRHILDSLSAISPIRRLKPGRLADVGSGAGLPGIPLAIWLDDVDVVLIERSGRRAGFLRTVAATLGLKNVSVFETAVEDLDAGAMFDIITFRAWSAIDEHLLDGLFPLLAPGGTIAAYKGRKSVVDKELSAVSDKVRVSAILPLKVPGLDDERHLVMIRPG